VEHVRSQLTVSERRACCVVGQARSTQRRRRKVRADEAALTEAIVGLATQYGRYGYRRIRGLLRDQGWQVSLKRVYRIWRREGLKVPNRQPKRGRLWLNDGSCIRLRPERPNHVWSYDFMQDRTEDGRRFRMLTVIDEFTRRCLAIVVARKLKSDDVLHCLTDLIVAHGTPEHIRSDNGPEFVARNLRAWLGRIGIKTLFIARQPVGERLLRELQLQAPRRVAGGRAVLDAPRSQGADRAMAAPLQCGQTAFLARLSPAGA
jgi:putative transposase